MIHLWHAIEIGAVVYVFGLVVFAAIDLWRTR